MQSANAAKGAAIGGGISAVGNDRRHIDSSLSHVLDFLESLYLAQIVNTEIEIFNV